MRLLRNDRVFGLLAKVDLRFAEHNFADARVAAVSVEIAAGSSDRGVPHVSWLRFADQPAAAVHQKHRSEHVRSGGISGV